VTLFSQLSVFYESDCQERAPPLLIPR
jgi:hypothetical protein